MYVARRGFGTKTRHEGWKASGTRRSLVRRGSMHRRSRTEITTHYLLVDGNGSFGKPYKVDFLKSTFSGLSEDKVRDHR